MSQAASNVDVLGNTENVKILANVLKTNVSACTSIGGFFLPQLGRIFNDMLGLYKAVSALISEQVASDGTFGFLLSFANQLSLDEPHNPFPVTPTCMLIDYSFDSWQQGQ